MKIKNIKMIVTDLDGTLLTSGKTVSAANRAAIQRLAGQDILFVIASGRALTSILLSLDAWGLQGLPDYIIHTNGFGYYETASGKEHTSYRMQKEWCEEIIHLYIRDGVCLMDHTGDQLIATCHNPTIDRVRTYHNLMPEYVDVDYFQNHCFPKLVLTASRETIDEIENRYQKFHHNPCYHGFRSASDVFEFVDARVSKGSAVRQLCQQLGFSTRQVVAFGDSSNDYDMLHSVFHSVAMENASDLIREITRYTTDTNDEDGVSSFINQFILGE